MKKILDKLGKQNMILLLFIIIVLAITGLYQTFSLFTQSNGTSMIDGIKTYNFILGENIENSVIIASKSSKNIAITITNKENIKLKYGIHYSSKDDLSQVSIGYSPTSIYPSNGLIDAENDYVVTIKIYNNSSEDKTISFGISYGFENGGDLLLENNQHWMSVVYPYQKQVDYLESNGTQYISTGVAPSNMNIKVELEYQYLANNLTLDDSIMGSRSEGLDTRFYPSSLGGTNDRHVLGDNEVVSTSDLNKHTVLFNDEAHDTYLDGTKIGNLGTSFTTHNQPMYLFGLNFQGSFQYQSHSRIYHCKIWDNGTLIRDYIPVIDYSSIPCLYDKVTDTLYYNNAPDTQDFSTNLYPSSERVPRNTEVTLSYLKNKYSINDNSTISNLIIEDSEGNTISSKLEKYDIYTVVYEVNGRKINQKYIPVPDKNITLTNSLNNPSFENELSNFYNGNAYRSNSIKRTGNYSMYITSSNNQQFLIFLYGNIGIKNNQVYIRTYAFRENTTVDALLYVYEAEASDTVYNPRNARLTKYANFDTEYPRWKMISGLTTPQSSNYEYLQFQYSQGKSTGTGNVYWDDSMAIVMNTDDWDSIPTTAWLDEMVIDFTGSKTFNWNN